jgi:glycosyltransferase involved in cell wall biosynthesis
MSVKVSVIIPCYNQGIYLDECINSVLSQTFQDFEIIIVNDGSTDEYTNELLKNYNKPKTKVIETHNQGLAMARNNGIAVSQGKYILPLDADDKIGNTYLEQAVKVLDSDNAIGIVYCEAEFFGEKKGKWELTPFNLPEFLNENQIFCSAFFRKDHYNKTKGYDKNMFWGLEDWDFWLTLIQLNVKVYRIPEILFYYRIKNQSMISAIQPGSDKKKRLNSYLFHKHIELYNDYLDPISAHKRIKQLENLNNLLFNSTSYKLGHFLIKPFVFIKKILNSNK